MQPSPTPRAWAEIDLDALVHNFHIVQKAAAGSALLCVVKANAYGHGVIPVAQALSEAGALHFAVATPGEALQLRRHGFRQSILLLGSVDAAWAPLMAENDVAMTVSEYSIARAYAGALNGSELAVHIKLDTGMHRLGLTEEDAADSALAIAALPHLRVEGLFTHFAAADEESENAFTTAQLSRFEAIAARLAKSGLQPLRHCANSAGILSYPASHLDMVRPGIMLYGADPCRPFSGAALRPVMALKTRIAQLHHVPKGESVSYGRTWSAPRDSLIATLSIGYADGLFRSLSGKLSLLVQGQKAPQVGRICMDMCMLDVTAIEGVTIGDTVTIFGKADNAALPAEEVAAAAGTIPYEIFCAVSARVPRVYFRGGKQLAADDSSNTSPQ